MNSTRSGYHHLTTRPSSQARTSSALSEAPSATTTQAIGISKKAKQHQTYRRLYNQILGIRGARDMPTQNVLYEIVEAILDA